MAGGSIDYSKLSDEQLQAIVDKDYSKLPDNVLEAIVAEEKAGQEPQLEKPDTIPTAPAAGVIGAATGPLTGKAVTPAVDTAVEFAARKMSGAPAQPPKFNTPQEVQNWLKTQTSGPFAGGRTQEEAYRKSEIAAGKPVQSRGSNIPIRKGALGIGNQPPEMTPTQKIATNVLSQERLKSPGLFGRVVGMGAAGSEFGKTAEEIEKGHYGHAALSTLGGLGALASQSNIKPVRRVGQAMMVGVPALQYLMGDDEEPQGHAGGGSALAKNIGTQAAISAPFMGEEIKALKHAISAQKYPEAIAQLGDMAYSVFAPFTPLTGGLSALFYSPELGAGTLDEYRKDLKENPHPNRPEIQTYDIGGKVKKIATQILKASEALAPHEGKYLGLTQSDNFGVHGGRMGGNQFPNFQNISPLHAKDRVVWMNDTEQHAKNLANVGQINGKDVIFSTYLGRPDQLKSNKTVFNDILQQHYARELTPEQIDLINNRIATLERTKSGKRYKVFPEPFDIRDKFAAAELGGDTFERRGELASMLGAGEGVGKTRGGIALPQYEDILASHRDPLTEGVPTSSVGTRLFTVDPTPPRYSEAYHPDYRWTVHGEDQGVSFTPVPQNLAVPDWFNEINARAPGKTHGNAWFSYMKDPQFISEEYLTNLQKAGHAEGGPIISEDIITKLEKKKKGKK